MTCRIFPCPCYILELHEMIFILRVSKYRLIEATSRAIGQIVSLLDVLAVFVAHLHRHETNDGARPFGKSARTPNIARITQDDVLIARI